MAETTPSQRASSVQRARSQAAMNILRTIYSQTGFAGLRYQAVLRAFLESIETGRRRITISPAQLGTLYMVSRGDINNFEPSPYQPTLISLVRFGLVIPMSNGKNGYTPVVSAHGTELLRRHCESNPDQ